MGSNESKAGSAVLEEVVHAVSTHIVAMSTKCT